MSMTTIRKAALTWETEYGPGTRADVGSVFVKLMASGRHVFDAQLPVVEFLKLAEDLARDAGSIRAALAHNE